MMARPGNNQGSYTSSLLAEWKKAFAQKKFAVLLAASLFYLIVLSIFLSHFLLYIDQRPGTQLRNLWIEHLPPTDLSIPLFILIYLSLLITLWYVLDKPRLFLRLLLSLALMYTFRCITLYLFPLEPPVGCIPLTDPLVKWLTPDRTVVVKDLFFSGHTALLFICILIVRKRYFEIVLCCALVAVIVMLLFQHAHYFIDIGGAFVITPACWILSGRILSWLPGEDKERPA